MNGVLIVLLALLGLVLQSTLFNQLAVAGVKPDLVLILALFYSIFRGPLPGGLAGFFLGLLEDLYVGRLIGMNALAKGLTTLLSGWLAERAFRENMLVPIITLFLGSLFNQFVFLLLGKVGGLDWPLSLWFWKGLPVAIYNACLVPFVYVPFFQWATRDQEEQIHI